MKASRWSLNPSRAERVAKWSVMEAGGLISLTLLQPQRNGTFSRLTLQFTKQEMQEVLDFARPAKWVIEKRRPR